jgi:hypothetical protein
MIFLGSFINHEKCERGMETMSYEKLLAIKEDILKLAHSENLFQDLNRAVEGMIADCDDEKMTRSSRREIIELIISIEMIKIRFLRGEVRAKDLHREIDFRLRQFRMRYQNFNYQDNPIFDAYF